MFGQSELKNIYNLEFGLVMHLHTLNPPFCPQLSWSMSNKTLRHGCLTKNNPDNLIPYLGCCILQRIHHLHASVNVIHKYR